ncbi:leucine-rich repeat-containing protein 74B-like [Saccostrea echinata]|uniref:leucine-rich repeat-containing protein 74B-like n=1 Tax=Saccostrea echinata TaxID=191078 RepID=UPI002A83BD8C|nr:leucine-rich repeat-containing protein 74B-like [Saccostrea echinata]
MSSLLRVQKQDSDLSRRVLSPLVEELDEDAENRPPNLEEFLPVLEKEKILKEENVNTVTEDDSLNNNDIQEDGFLDADDENVSDDEEYFTEESISLHTDPEDYDTDLEIDTESLLNPKTVDHDTTGKTKYIKKCFDLGINPVSYFVKNLENKELKLRFHGLGAESVKAISFPLETNTNIEILNLEGNGIDGTGARCLCRVLRENLFLTEVVLSENKIGTEGAISMCQFLKSNRNLLKVDMTANEIGDPAGQSFYDVLKGNQTLKELILANNRLEETSARFLKDGIQENDTLEILDLSWNHFKTRGAVAIAEGLQENVGLKKFRFQMAGLAKAGSEAMMKALKQNRTLRELDISFNRIQMEGATFLAEGLKENDALQYLKVGNNPFEGEGAMLILEAVDSNENSAIKYLDFSNMLVKAEFATIEDRLREQRNLKIKHEGILPEMHPKNGTYARLSAFRRDPIETFKKYAEFSGVNLHDVFNGGHRLRLDAAEFKDLIKGSGIDIPDQQLTVLIRTLDVDGFINYNRILEENGSETPFSPEPRSASVVSFASEKSEKSVSSARRRASSTDTGVSTDGSNKPKSAKDKSKKKEKKKKK